MLMRVWVLLLAVCVMTLATGCKGDDEGKSDKGGGTGQTSTAAPTPDSNGDTVKPLADTGTPPRVEGRGTGNGAEGSATTRTVDGAVKSPTTHPQLITAVAEGDLDAVKAALAANPKWLDQEGKPYETPLTTAILNGRSDIALFLIKKHADPNLGGPLHLAAASAGMDDVIEALLDAGVDVDAPGPKGETPLHVAAETDRLTAVRILIDRGASVEARNEAGLRPLHKAALFGNVRTVEWLLKQNAFPNARASDGRTPLSIATAGNFKPVIDALEAAGATLEGVPAESEPSPGE